MPPVKAPLPYRLYNEDCFATFSRLGAGTVDLVLCDPPYGTTACSWDSVIPLSEMWRELERVIRPKGSIVITANQPFTSALVMSNPKLFKYSWVWEKNRPTLPHHAKNRPMGKHEDILVFSKGKMGHAVQVKESRMVYNPQGAKQSVRKVVGAESHSRLTGARSGQLGIGYVSVTGMPHTILKFSKDEDHVHPTQKPVKLMDYLIRTYTNEGDTVLDFAMGSGTTGVAAMHLGRKFIGCDSDTSNGYFDTAELRIKTAWKQAQQKRPST